MIDAKEYRTRIYETWSIPMLETSAISVVGRMLDPSDQMQQGEGNGALLRSSFAAWKMKPAANSNYPQVSIPELALFLIITHWPVRHRPGMHKLFKNKGTTVLEQCMHVWLLSHGPVGYVAEILT